MDEARARFADVVKQIRQAAVIGGADDALLDVLAQRTAALAAVDGDALRTSIEHVLRAADALSTWHDAQLVGAASELLAARA